MDKLHQLAREKLTSNVDKMKQRYDLKTHESFYQPGDLVYLYNPRRKKGRCPKLQRNWQGPWQIVEGISDLVYRIRKQNKTMVVNVERLAKYNEDLGTTP
jgi:hypothetical protein